MSYRYAAGAVALALAAIAPVAQAQSAGFHPVLGAIATGGGDTLVEVHYTNGDSHKVSAGGLLQVFGGMEYRGEGSPVTTSLTVGYHIDGVNAKNGDLRFSRVPVELTFFWNASDRFRIGAGLRKALSSEFRSSGDVDVGDFNAKSSVGGLVQADWFFTPGFSLLVRGVTEKYKSSKLKDGEADGSHVGIGVSYRF